MNLHFYTCPVSQSGGRVLLSSIYASLGLASRSGLASISVYLCLAWLLASLLDIDASLVTQLISNLINLNSGLWAAWCGSIRPWFASCRSRSSTEHLEQLFHALHCFPRQNYFSMLRRAQSPNRN